MKRLQSGKFWLKSLTAAVLLFAAGFAAQHLLLAWLFSPEKLRQAADAAVAGTGRKVRFVDEGRTTVFPRPTVTLKQVEITRAHGEAAEIRAEEMRLGIGWGSLWGEPRIEKWVLLRPELSLSRDAAGKWNVADLLAKESRFAVDRIIVEDGRLLLDTPERRHTLENVSLNVNNADDAQTQIKAAGRLKTPLWENDAEWKLQGTLNRNAQGWRMPELAIEGGSKWRGAAFSFRFAADVAWRRDSGKARFSKAALKLDIPDYEMHLNAESPALEADGDSLTAAAANAVLTAKYGGAAWDGTLDAKNIGVWPDRASAEQIGLKGSRKTDATHTAFTLDTPLAWRKGGWEMPSAKLTTRMENAAGNPRPRLISELEGVWTYSKGAWQGSMKGQLDREAVSITAGYTPAESGAHPARLTAKLQLDKLILTPYLENLPEGAAAYPSWLQKSGAPEIEADISVNTLQTAQLEINRLSTRLLADKNRIVLPDFRAELYNGSTEGGISMANTSPPTYHLQQYARNISIRPLMQDLLRYGSISGSGDAEIDITAQGGDRAALTRTLAGTLELNLAQGTWLGINLNQALQNLLGNRPVKTDAQSVTPFEQFTISSVIRKGIGRHEKAELRSENLRVELTGNTDFNTMTLNEQLKLYPAGGDGSPVPLNIRGKPDNPSVTIDYKSLTEGLDTAEEKQQALARALREQWQWLNAPKTAKTQERPSESAASTKLKPVPPAKP